MLNYVQDGKNLKLTAPAGGVVSGQGYMIGSLFVVALVTAAEGAEFTGVTEGVVESTKEATTAAFSAGETVYWDDTEKRLDESGSGFYPVGCAIEDAEATDATVKVKLVGNAVEQVA